MHEPLQKRHATQKSRHPDHLTQDTISENDVSSTLPAHFTNLQSHIKEMTTSTKHAMVKGNMEQVSCFTVNGSKYLDLMRGLPCNTTVQNTV